MWQKKDLTYTICVPPISKPFESFNSAETKSYFDWYVNIIPDRIQYLTKVISDDLGTGNKFNILSPESLVQIWTWFLREAKIETTASDALHLDMQTEYIVRDIGMYVGEMFNSHYSCINWGYYEMPKTDFFVNRPLLIGFKDNSISPPFNMVFEPIHMIRVQACKLLSNRQKNDDLLKLYNKWAEKII